MNDSSRVPPSVVLDLLPVPGASRLARDIVTETCAKWGLPDLIAPAALVVSELVANVAEHVGTAMTLRLTRHGSAVEIAVQDGSSAPPVLQHTATDSLDGGRGLLLIGAVSSAWGYRLEEHGKTVWATVDPPGPGLRR